MCISRTSCLWKFRCAYWSLNGRCFLADCAHEYCTGCCKRHAERKILSRSSQIDCPHANCSQNFDIEQCGDLLCQADLDILSMRQREAGIPALQRVYCPFPDCSVFIPLVKFESSSSGTDTFVECRSCHRGFCLECNIPWERTCGICVEKRIHAEFMSTKGEFSYAIGYRRLLFLALTFLACSQVDMLLH